MSTDSKSSSSEVIAAEEDLLKTAVDDESQDARTANE